MDCTTAATLISVWDPEQLAEIPVIADRLQAAGDPLGEWLALRLRLESEHVPGHERKLLRRRARILREQLGPRLILADNPGLGRPHAVRELGLLADLSFAAATPGHLAQLCARPDAPFVLRLQLRGELVALLGCVELLLDRQAGSQAGSQASPPPPSAERRKTVPCHPGEADSRGPKRTRTSLRTLSLGVVDAGGERHPEEGAHLHENLSARAAELGARLPSLFDLEVDARPIPLPFDLAALDTQAPWTPSRRAALGRALASPESEHRRRALVRLREHGEVAGSLRARLLAIIEHDPAPEVRAAAFAVVPRLGPLAPAIIAILGDAARQRDDPQLREWLDVARRF